MAKRYTATEIWSEDWFLCMPNEYKLFWYFMLSACDHGGLFRVNLKSFCTLNEVKISPAKALDFFNESKIRIRVINNSLWLIEDFFVYQYGQTFNENNRVHASILDLYKKNEIQLSSIRGLKEVKYGVKDKDKDIDKDKNIEKEQLEEGNNEFEQKSKEDMIVLEMMKVWNKHNPKYLTQDELDYSACLEMAYKIAKVKGWKKQQVLYEKQNDCVASWEKIVLFIRSDSFLKKLAVQNINNQFQMVIQKMTNPDEVKEIKSNQPKIVL